MWTLSNTLLLFLFIFLIIGIVLALSVVTQNDVDIVSDNTSYQRNIQANKTRSLTMLLTACALGVLILVIHFKENQLLHM